MLGVAAVLVLHVAAPVVLAGKRLAALTRPGAASFGAVILARLVVLVVDVAVQMRLGAEAPVAVGMRALMRPFVVALVVAKRSV